ncbi:patatin-like phospholipase family protein [Burkholderia diffusa]|uniref:patatin-like phospholipase family protein n=1 Tax=Burkholderia diffusa TaxID=488732 RepID=UPI0015821F63|nr:patatin-like phospholipase family protein [Burkholderia diffusa]
MNSLLLAVVGILLAQSAAGQCLSKGNPSTFCPPDIASSSPLQRAAFFSFEHPGKTAPQLGLALSGGGTRAGYFAHGVFQGLNDAHILDHVDIISSVSGGGYAAYWYFERRYAAAAKSQDFHGIFADCFPAWLANGGSGAIPLQAIAAAQKKANDKRLTSVCEFDNSTHYLPGDPYRWQAYLARYPNLFAEHPTSITGDAQEHRFHDTLTTDRALSLLLKAARLTDKNTETVGKWYEQGIDRVWGNEPSPRTGNYLDARGVEIAHAWDISFSNKLTSFHQLQNFTIKNSSAPLWILNTKTGKATVNPEPSSIFEITPFSYGSEKTGFAYGTMPVNLLEAVRLSAAFMDAQGVVDGSKNKGRLKFMNTVIPGAATWGRDIDLPRLSDTSIHLSDGGSEENLGLYSLVRRGVPNIIIVDGEQDPAGQLESLCRVKEGLAVQGQILSIENLIKLDDVCGPSPDGLKRGYNTSEWLNPIMHGYIHRNAAPPQEKPIQIWYVKLGWDQLAYRAALTSGKCENSPSDVSCFLTMFYGENSSVVDKLDGYMLFPQIDTVGMTVRASSYFFWAYRELGREAGRRLVWNTKTHQLASTTPECKQLPYRLTGRGRRAFTIGKSGMSWSPCKTVHDPTVTENP